MKKKVVIITSLLLIVTISICVVLAFLTDSEETTNTFTIGKVDISLYETAVNELGEPIEGAEPVTENTYHLLPGKTYVKDPTITVEAGSDEAYIRMLVTLNLYKEIKEVFGSDFLPENYVSGYNPDKWIYIGSEENTEKNTITYEFRYYEPVDGFNNEVEEELVLEPLFTSLVIPGEIEANNLEKIADLEIKVVGHAIQKSGLDTADEAWNAFDKQYNE